MTYLEEGNQWFLPLLAGPSSFLSEVIGSGAVRRVLNVLSRLSPDGFMHFTVNFYQAGLERFGDTWAYADINTVLAGFSRILDIQDYLEIGVRRGRSMAMVASHATRCHIVGFDLWIENYAGMENPGEQFVRGELQRVGFLGKADFFEGDSKVTIPRYFKEHPDKYFDMVTVDGDHSLEGARTDLNNVIPRLKKGGVLIFDDISHQDHSYLGELWNDLIENDKRFAAHSFTEVGFGIGFAIRKY